jgi:hypothetical protein
MRLRFGPRWCYNGWVEVAAMDNALRIRTVVQSETLQLPELRALIGKEVEIIVLSPMPDPPNGNGLTVKSIDELRSNLPGDPFGDDFEQTLGEWRRQPWRADEPEDLK